jgi:hypothetical protein
MDRKFLSKESENLILNNCEKISFDKSDITNKASHLYSLVGIVFDKI